MAIVGTRPLTREDEPLLWDMLQLAIFMPDGSVAPRSILEKPEVRRYVEGWGLDDDLGFAAIILTDGQPVGAAWTRLLRADSPGYGYVGDDTPELTIAIREEWRSQGVGSFMIRQLIDQLRRKYPGVSLSVSPRNPAVELYQRLGFSQTSKSGDSITMLRRFEPVPEK